MLKSDLIPQFSLNTLDLDSSLVSKNGNNTADQQ